jgi:DNA-binding transcriptional LysR family regulator
LVRILFASSSPTAGALGRWLMHCAIAADMAGHGVGVCLLNEELVNGSRLHNVLVGPLDQCVADRAGFYLVRPREKSLSGAAKAFSEWVKTQRNGPAAVPCGKPR